MKIEVDNKTIDKLVGKRVTEFNKKIRDLEAKLKRRDNKIHKLQKEIEKLKGDLMDTSEGQAKRIAELAYGLLNELKTAKWVEDFNWCPHCDDDCYLK